MRVSLAGLLILLALLAPRAGHAQLADTVPPLASPTIRFSAAPSARGVVPAATQSRRSPEVLALGGLVGGGIGLVAGLAVGALLDGAADEDCIDMCFGPGMILGTLAGEALGVALGVHLVNGRRGSLPLSVLTSAGILTVGLIAGNNLPPMLVIVPVTQIIASITVERRTARDR